MIVDLNELWPDSEFTDWNEVTVWAELRRESLSDNASWKLTSLGGPPNSTTDCSDSTCLAIGPGVLWISSATCASGLLIDLVSPPVVVASMAASAYAL